jgi:hypothetical protein
MTDLTFIRSQRRLEFGSPTFGRPSQQVAGVENIEVPINKALIDASGAAQGSVIPKEALQSRNPLRKQNEQTGALTGETDRSALKRVDLSDPASKPAIQDPGSNDHPKELIRLKGRRCDPLLWRQFSYEKTSKTSKFRECLINKVVSLSIPKNRTDRDVAEEIARECCIPVESLCEDLKREMYSRGQAILGFAGDEFDKIADNYDNMQWWVSEAGLNMAIATPADPHPRVPTFDELLGGDVADQGKHRGDLTLLRKGDGRLYDSVDFPTAEKYADISARRRQQLIAAWLLKVMGHGQKRRITVESLMMYCPPAEDAK